MAKKKKRRPTSSSRPGGSGGVATSTSARRGSAVPTVKPAPSEPGGPNRLARKEEARRQREAIRRRMARRRFLRRGGIVALAVAVVAGVGVYVALKPNPAKQAGCGDVRTIQPYDPAAQDRGHISVAGTIKEAPDLSTYRSVPPVSGPHSPTPLGAGVYDSPPDIYQVIHSLEHGAVVIWYVPGSAADPELASIRSFYSQTSNNDHVIVAPYSYPDQGAAGRLPAEMKMVSVAWHHLQSCPSLSLNAAKSFVSGYRHPLGVVSPAGYKGDAPEAGAAI
jgi:hypothetical protein